VVRRYGPRPRSVPRDGPAARLATEVDLDSTFVGGSARLIDELLADERLEAWPASATDPTDAGSDRINRAG
jgi:hypothetical protein